MLIGGGGELHVILWNGIAAGSREWRLGREEARVLKAGGEEAMYTCKRYEIGGWIGSEQKAAIRRLYNNNYL